MATDEFISHIRKKKVEKEYTDSIDIRLTQEPDTDDDLSDKKQRFEKALNQLPEKQKITLMMNKMQGLTHKEIAEILNLSQKAIEKRIRLALETLKQNLNHV
jgi:RNA polymerase sigma-70 factor (ECF subfamily)